MASHRANAARLRAQILVDGPYGHPGLRPADYGRVVLVAGGIGVTPLASMLASILDGPPPPLKVTFVDRPSVG